MWLYLHPPRSSNVFCVFLRGVTVFPKFWHCILIWVWKISESWYRSEKQDFIISPQVYSSDKSPCRCYDSKLSDNLHTFLENTCGHMLFKLHLLDPFWDIVQFCPKYIFFPYTKVRNHNIPAEYRNAFQKLMANNEISPQK